MTTPLDNLALFTECQNRDLPAVLQAYVSAGITATNVLVTAPDPQQCAALMPQLQKLGPVSFARQLIDGDADWAACGGTAATGTVDSVLQCYHDKIQTAVPSGGKFAGIAWSDEGEGVGGCGGNPQAKFNAVLPGPWSRLYPMEKRVQMASGPGPQYCPLTPTTTLASACHTPQYCSGSTAAGPTDWFTEDSFEPYKLRLDPKVDCQKFGGEPATCCDGTTVCPLVLQTPCLMQNPQGWAAAAVGIPATSPGVNSYVTMGVGSSNADCGFGGADGASNAVAAAQSLQKLGARNVALYTRA